jgi:hypothetical protein
MTIVEKHACSQNKMNVSTKEVWDDVAGTAFGDAHQDCVNDAFEHGAVKRKTKQTNVYSVNT